jgi:phosphatidylglycerol lysyltransferase
MIGLRGVVDRLRARPVTTLIVLAMLVIGIVSITTGHRGLLSASLNPNDIRQRHWWVLLTSTLSADSVLQLVVAIIAAIFGLGAAERLMGSRRTLIAFLVTGVLANALGIGLEMFGAAVGEYWSSTVQGLVTFDPLTPIAGTIAWSSAWATPFWRRRLRVVLVAVAVALLLYSGQPADLYLLVAIGIGVLAGRLLHPGETMRFWRGSHHETRALLALVNAILAVGPLLTLVSVTRYGLLSPLAIAITDAAPRDVLHPAYCVASRLGPSCVGELTRMHVGGVGTVLVAVLPLLLMLVGSWGLLAGRRAAVWVLATLGAAESLLSAWYFGLLPASGSSTAVPPTPHHYAELGLWLAVSTLVPLVDAIVLIAFRRLFPVRLTRRARRSYLLALAAAVAGPTALYLSVGWALRAQFNRPLTDFWELVEQLPERLIPVSFLRHENLDFVAGSLATHVLLQSIGPLFWTIIVIATVVALRGTRGGVLEAQQAGSIRKLLAQGSGTLGYMATWAGNRLWVSSDGTLGIAYRVVAGFAVTTSDPIGLSTDPDAGLTEFLRFCDRAAWTPVFYSVHDVWRARLAARGWSSLPVAEETTIDPRTFTLHGKPMHDVRYAVNRAGREGVRAIWGSWQNLPPRVTRQISALSDEWMSDKDLPELGFTLGGLDELHDDEVLVGVALDEHDTVLAVTSWLPIRRQGELIGRTLDFMRRAPVGGNGIMEFLIAAGLLRFGGEGLELASLSGSPLARPTGESGGGPLGRVLRLVGTMLEPVYGFRSLLRFKRKFSPSLAPMHLVVPDPVALPAIGLAIARCYLPTLTVTQARRVLGSRR